MGHSERAHSPLSASGAERWFSCPGSVRLSEGLPDKSTIHAQIGTQAHELVEKALTHKSWAPRDYPKEMVRHALATAKFINGLKNGAAKHATLKVETRVYLPFIHPEMFGTTDAAVIEEFGTLHVVDFKYGVKLVSPIENLQMIFYALGFAHLFNWNFKKARLWIVQPRVRGYDGPEFWDVPMQTLKDVWVRKFSNAVRDVATRPKEYVEGTWCYWCKAQAICPLKKQAKLTHAREMFAN